MRKIFILGFCTCALCMCNGCVFKETPSTTKDVTALMEEAGFTSECKDGKKGFTCLYQNDASVAIMYQNDETLIYRNESGDTYVLDPKEEIGKMITPYQKLVRELDITSQDIYAALASMYDANYEKEARDKDESLNTSMKAGEYAVIVDDMNTPASLYVTNAKTSNVLYTNTGFYNTYIIIDEHAKLEIENATLYPVEEMPELEATHLFTTYKVGKDIEAGTYEVYPNSEGISAFEIYQKSVIQEAYKEPTIQEVDLLEEKMLITLDEGTYITFTACSFTPVL